MSAQQHKTIIQNTIRHFNESPGAVKQLEMYAPNVVHHGFPPNLPQGVEGLKQFYLMIQEAFPDMKVTTGDLIAEGDQVAYRFTVRATHKGTFMDIPATGKKVEIEGQTIMRFKDGKVVERWQSADMLGLLQQIGAIPTPGAARA